MEFLSLFTEDFILYYKP